MRSATTNVRPFTPFSMPRIQRAGMSQALANKENQRDSPTMFGLASGAEPVTPEVFKRPLKVVQPATADVSAADDLPTMESLVTWSNPPASLCALLTGEAVLLCAHYMFTLGDASFLSGEARYPRFLCCHRCIATCTRYAGFCAAVVCSETPEFLFHTTPFSRNTTRWAASACCFSCFVTRHVFWGHLGDVPSMKCVCVCTSPAEKLRVNLCRSLQPTPHQPGPQFCAQRVLTAVATGGALDRVRV